jgi:hypothetical protein
MDLAFLVLNPDQLVAEKKEKSHISPISFFSFFELEVAFVGTVPGYLSGYL